MLTANVLKTFKRIVNIDLLKIKSGIFSGISKNHKNG
jgi:hypothetical protein